MIYFSRKMIPTKIYYETHNSEFLAIVEAFKICRHNLKGFKHEVFILINYNNLQ